MKLIANSTFKGQLGLINLDQEFDAPDSYAQYLLEKGMAREAGANKSKGAAPKNKSAGGNASSSPAAPASRKTTRKKQNS